ncbi:hypothetical protein M413DRAFT_437873 [Hebeloma cylindrosporum]|uniref:C3H1-type domain-containing protein n=1 Tax=Hebeloma cylindrosporum TaxID=76867 RepID=A0A0C2YG52_HEBCY|nr:hypothetical protein M413DRAFT_437873 [Hebeloma cylindrosporum h7]
MALSEPSWRVKTQPCPFYQQGKCMFADSCNFIHNVSATVIPEAGPGTPQLPDVIVNSPNSIRSPPRSPRTTSLLLALRDVIGYPDCDVSIPVESVSENAPNPEIENWSETLPTLVNEFGFGHHSQPDGNIPDDSYLDQDDENDSSGHWTAISDYDDEDQTSRQVVPVNATQGESGAGLLEGNDPNLGHMANSTSPVLGNDSSSTEPVISFAGDRNSIASTSGSGLLSPIELSNLHLGPFRQMSGRSNRNTNSFDSGYADNWKPPIPMRASPPRSPSISSTFDLLSSPFGSHSARMLSPYLGPFIPRSPVSPARTLSPHIAEDIEPLDLSLDSPSHDGRNQPIPPENPPGLADGEPSEPLLDPDELQRQLDEPLDESDDEEILEQSYSYTSIWDSEGTDTAVFMGNDALIPIEEQVDDAINRLSKTPTHFLTAENLQFDGSEVEGSSFTRPGDSSSFSADAEGGAGVESQQHSSEASENSLDEDDTSLLAYAHSPLNTSQENDTLTSLYDIYSDTTLERDPISNSRPSANLLRTTNSSLSNSSTPSSSLRERVFTPPPVTRKRSGTITADSPTSLASPMTSLDSVSMGRASPFSPLGDKHSSRSYSPYGQEVEVSRKVPFGFRSSFSLGSASRSSLMTSRQGERSVPSPLQTHAEDPIPEPQHSGSDTSFSGSGSKGLKPLRLSTILDANISQSPSRPASITKPVNSSRLSGTHHRASISSASVSSNNSLSHSRLLSSTRSSLLPSHIRNSLLHSEAPSPLSTNFFESFANLDGPQSAPVDSWRNSVTQSRPSSLLSEPFYDDDEEPDTIRYKRDPFDETIRRLVPQTAPVNHAPSQFPPSIFAIETPKPTLMFAIASDDVKQVRQVLESGDAGPNDAVGPQSALAFTLTNDKLANKLEIVKTLLAYGADPKVAKTIQVPVQPPLDTDDPQQLSQEAPPTQTLMDIMDPATKYYLERAEAVHTRRISVLIQRSFFRPLTRVRYELIGQDRALEQLFRVLSMHSRDLAASPMVVMLCGPSGHGKSLLARKFGSLLDVPTHTVNMTTLRSTHDLWQSYSMSPYETPTTCTLAEFLINNEGKRCVVVLDEIEKTEDPKTLWSLLMPWELGRCAFEAGTRHVDVKNVIWLGTSNIGHDLVFQHRDSRKNPEEPMSREEYVELMALLRPKVSERLGASVLSRITTVLPFVPFTLEEMKAICSETLSTLGGEFLESSSPETIEAVIKTALSSYCAIEGARSLHRAISNQLVDIM